MLGCEVSASVSAGVLAAPANVNCGIEGEGSGVVAVRARA
jgi:hypothetical protein